eukprot:1176181-Prorocentrum_minimum.AAC.4
MTETNQTPKRPSAPTNRTQEARVYSHDEHQSDAEEGLRTDYRLRIELCGANRGAGQGSSRRPGGGVKTG